MEIFKEKEKKVRFKLPEAAFRKLCRLVKQRDEELAETYQSIIGEWPPSRGEVHHAKHAGSGGSDKEDNLIHLSYEMHRFKAHGLSGTRKQYVDEQIRTYLNCKAVKEWRKEHEMELQELLFFMDENNTYTSSGGRKFKIIKNPRGYWSVQSGDKKERVSIEWQS